MVKNENALQQFAQQRYKLFQNQNSQTGQFDVTFQFGDKKLFAHSFILWPISKVFEKMLFGPLAEKGPITPKRYEYESFKEFLTYLYIGKCKINAQNVMDLVDMSECYHIKPFKDECDEFITENANQTENVLKLYESLKHYTLKAALAKLLETIASKTSEILKSNDFLEIKKDTIMDIVKMDNLTSKEEELFQAVLKWAAHKYGNNEGMIKTEIAEILPFVRFPIMNLEFLHSFVVSKGYIFPSFEELSKILRDATAFAQNGSSAQKCSPYSSKFRGGLRIQFFGSQNFKAYADVQDPTVIEAIKKSLKNRGFNQGQEISIQYFHGLQIKGIFNKVDSPVGNTKYYLVYNSSMGGLTIQRYDQQGDMYLQLRQNVDDSWFFKEYDVIAPMILENNNFDERYHNIFHQSEITVKVA